MTNTTIERQILAHLIHTEEYTRKILPYIKEEYFQSESEKCVYKSIKYYLDKYNKLPSVEALQIDLEAKKEIPENVYSDIEELLGDLTEPSKVDIDWLTDKTEKFCQDSAINNAIMEAINIQDGKSKLDKGAIPDLLRESLAVSFDHRVGHDFIGDFESRFEFYRKKEKRVRSDLNILNQVTKGGVPNKTLNVILAGTGVGKSLAMCHMAAANLLEGKNVLYITLEMAEERIAERIDANLLDITLEELGDIPKESYYAKMAKLKSKTLGKLVIKEYPTSSANVGHFRHLLSELWLKKNFRPDIIYIDYINICSSSRLKQTGNINSYFYIKAIAEEFRGLAVEQNVPIWTATQVTRSGFDSSDIGLTDTSESFGLPATADFMIALISTDDLAALNQIKIKQLKNRYNDMNFYNSFIVGIDRSKMRLYNVENSAQVQGTDEEKPVFDNTNMGEEDNGFVWKPKKKALV